MVTEESIYRLEAYLDGALDSVETAKLAVRLEREPALRAALADLEAFRSLRGTTWEALEGTACEGAAVADRFVAAAVRRQETGRRLRTAGWISAAAAVVAIGFGIGWSSRTIMAPQPAAPMVRGAPPAAENGYRVALTDSVGNVIAVQRFGSFDDAQRFTRDLNEWQDRREQLTEGQVLLVGDRF